ncbi:cation:proton antiporter [Knoellia sp. Soil729]|uniref:cation:proton antiporter n=1 Tax=Knoellia sp. Soil729 TaxID=1736394 RepID=UPI000A8031F0|nr:cation:proton antiporter [Knoellia sp. Soil729]
MLLLAFAGTLFVAVLLSHRANRTILSTAVLFLVAGIVLGDGLIGAISFDAEDETVSVIAEIALFAVLFTDGMRAGWSDLRAAWRLPGRALLLGLPLTLAITAVLAHYLVGLGWPQALLIGAILSPTDPVFASALVGNARVPGRLRHLLNVESGVNDGLALPFVVIFLALSQGSKDLELGPLAGELALGLAIGVVLPWVAISLENTSFFRASHAYEPLSALAVGLLVFAAASLTHANLFIASFAAGITLASVGPHQAERFTEFGELISELLKLGALLVFGALITPMFVDEIDVWGWLLAVLAIVVARPVALWLSFLGSHLSMREQAAAMWFGPKGFASVVYGLLVVDSGIPDSDLIFHLVALTVVISIILHSSTDVVVARAFDEAGETPQWQGSVAVEEGAPRRE